MNILMIDNRDSFTYNLVDAFRRDGHVVSVHRNHIEANRLLDHVPDLLVISPGPGRPADAGRLMEIIRMADAHGIPMFGVCLGMEALIEHAGGTLTYVQPMHGRKSAIYHDHSPLFDDLPIPFNAGRYHSLAADHIPSVFRITAHTADGLPMAIQHTYRTICAVQFHPESILTAEREHGQRILRNMINWVKRKRQPFQIRQAVFPRLHEPSSINSILSSIENDELTDVQLATIIPIVAEQCQTAHGFANFIQTIFEYTQISPTREHALDVCGTGGSGVDRINVSTLTALVLAVHGRPVVKHGNKAASGRYGSFDLIEDLGIPVRKDRNQLTQQLEEVGLALVFAPIFFPIFGRLKNVRKALGQPTVFNLMGPLLNPFQPAHQWVGTAFPEYAELMLDTLIELGREKAAVVSSNGFDDVMPSRDVHIVYSVNGNRGARTIRPADFGYRHSYSDADLRVESIDSKKQIAQALIEGRADTIYIEWIAANAALIECLFYDDIANLKSMKHHFESLIRSGSLMTLKERLIRESDYVDA